MAQSGFTPIQLYYSTSAGNTPLAADLANGELAINTNDGVLYYKDSGGVVQVIASGSSVSVLAVEVATTTNLASLSGLLTVDGITVTAGQRVLVKDQTSSQNNGVYVAAVGAWTRSIDCNSSAEIAGRVISVRSGSTNGGEQWATTFKSTNTLGTTAMAWYQVALQNTAVTFTDLTATGNTTLGDADTDTITQTASYVTGTQLKSAKTATNTLNLAAYDTDGATYTNLITLMASTTPTLALTSTGVGTINNISVGATTASTGAFTTLSATGVATFSAGSALAPAITTTGDTNTGIFFPAADTIAFAEGGVEAMRIDSSGNVGIGTTSPAAKIHLSQTYVVPSSGGISADTIGIFSNNNVGLGTCNVSILGRSSGYQRLYFGNQTVENAQFIESFGNGGASGYLAFGVSSNSGTAAGTEAMRITSAGDVGIGTSSPAVKLAINSTDAILLPKGTTAQQPTGVAGYLRFNTTTTQFEGYNGTAWSSVGGAAIVNDTTTATDLYPLFAGATSGTALTIYTGNANLLYKPSTGELTSRVPIAGNGIVVNNQTVATSYTIAAGYSGMSAGPVTVASGQSVTVSSGSRWVVQ